MTQPELTAKYATDLANMCLTAESALRESAEAFKKLKAAIEAEGYQVIWHMHSGDYSVIKHR